MCYPIKAEFGIDMPIRTVGEYLKRWSYTPQRPTRQALVKKPWGVHCWMQEIYPLIAQKAKQKDGIIYWVDATALAQEGHWVGGYAPAGHAQPAFWLDDDFGHQQKTVGAVRVSRRCRAMAQITIGFMQRLVQDREGQKVFLVHINLRAHHAKEVAAWSKRM